MADYSSFIYALPSSSGLIKKYDLSTLSLQATATIASGNGFTSDGTYLYSVNPDTNSKLNKFNLSDLALVKQIQVSGATFGQITTDGTYLYVSDGSGIIRKYDNATLTLQATSDVAYGSAVYGMSTKEGYLYVAGHSITGKIYKYDTATLTKRAESAVYGGTIDWLAISGAYVYIGGSTVYKLQKYDIATLTLQKSVTQTTRIRAGCIIGDYIYIVCSSGYFYKYDLATLTLQTTSPSGTYGTIYAIAGSGNYIYGGGTNQYIYKLDISTLALQTTSPINSYTVYRLCIPPAPKSHSGGFFWANF